MQNVVKMKAKRTILYGSLIAVMLIAGCIFLRAQQKDLKCMANVRSMEYLYHAYERSHGRVPMYLEDLESMVREGDDVLPNSFKCPWSGQEYVVNPRAGSAAGPNGILIIWCPKPHPALGSLKRVSRRTVAFRDYADGGIQNVTEREFETFSRNQREGR